MSQNQAEQMMQEADRYLDFGNLAGALSVYQKIIEADPQHDEAHTMLGSVYGEMGNIDLASRHLNTALEINAQNPDAWMIKGMMQKGLGNVTDAISCFANAAKYDNAYDEAHINHADALLETGQYAAAVEALEFAVSCNAANAQARARLPRAYAHSGALEKSAQAFVDMLTAQPDSQQPLLQTIAELTRDNRLDDAEVLVSHIIERSGNIAWLHKTLSDIKLEQGYINHALDSIDKAIALAPDAAEYLLRKAELIEMRGDYEQALELLRPMLESSSPVFTAIVIFAKFAPYLDMTSQATQLIEAYQSSNFLAQEQTETLNQALAWLGARP